ncbi:hypothetical protein F542_8070 [Bibersteinia trehalosi USDA-ARS-USMARC-188]|uniref:Periplasmic protein n=2 Tax=Bibersteinia trehalosi TaxID=47735 RepID=A0A4V7I926_BIBTR|nr:hypothetical protein [Bibersteinia trehalosi]AGH38674.1 hypothetical protein WQG_13970 [Bibersteinia trehalosi USDA-ARS-USMARC-192]AHG81525.1 hypothetical protein F542_8070 [Bibersteinia trehalosi USDA-ARS-USMARC-188]AHG83798.1 hypothetical protein F543_9340 [Bibersteinia trehalosi USDA-ARS-USMARC-189]
MKKLSLTLVSLLSTSLFAQIQLSPFPMQAIGKAAQLAVSDKDELFIINTQGELWQATPIMNKLSDGFSTQIAPSVAYNRVAGADKQGNFMLWTAKQLYTSTIPLAKQAGMYPLAFATIAVSKQGKQHKLVRIKTKGTQAEITAMASTEVLPDAQPMQIDFKHSAPNQGHIAILAKPDNSTYLHGVLGDAIEAAEVQYLERHTLEPLAEGLSMKGLVFEANRFEHFATNNGAKLVSVMSGNGEGGRTVLIGEQNGKLVLEQSSSSLPNNRWQSPFVFNRKLYAVQMPHLRGKLVEYTPQGAKLAEHSMQDGFSNHRYGEYETNLAASASHFAVLPLRDYRHIAILDSQGQLQTLAQTLPAEIQKTRASKDSVYLLLENGQIWLAQ